MCTAECTFGMFEERGDSGQTFFCVSTCEKDLFSSGAQQLCGCTGFFVQGESECYATCPEDHPLGISTTRECVANCTAEYAYLDESGRFCVEKCDYAFLETNGIKQCVTTCGAMHGPGESGVCALKTRTVVGVTIILLSVVGLVAVIAVLCIKKYCEQKKNGAALLEQEAFSVNETYTGVQNSDVNPSNVVK